ncbi:MAG: leucine-rich repeat domain-containing protein [Oscillospiraceae bacterium]
MKVKKIVSCIGALVICGSIFNFTPLIDDIYKPIVASAEVISTGSCGDDATYTITDDGVLTISGTGEISPLISSIGDINIIHSVTSVIIEDGITSIGYHAFDTAVNFSNITIPESVTSIGDEAFSNCHSLTEITIPESVTSIGKATFVGCTSLTKITIPKNVTSIGDLAFSRCENLTIYGESGSYAETYANENSIPFASISDTPIETTIDTTSITQTITTATTTPMTTTIYTTATTTPITTTIYTTATTTNDNNYSISFNDGTLTISGTGETPSTADLLKVVSGRENLSDFSSSTELYSYKTEVKSIIIEDGITSIGIGQFLDFSNLTEVSLPESLTSIGNGAFEMCNSLTKITIPKSVTSIGDNTFYNCDNLTIYGESDSYAEIYANENSIPFALVGDASVTTTKDTTTSTTEISKISNSTTSTDNTTSTINTTISTTDKTTSTINDKDISSPKTSDGGIASILALSGIVGTIAIGTKNKKKD